MRAARIAFTLAVREQRTEFRATLCYALAFAAMLTPLLILLALKNGLIEQMTRQLTEDPKTLQVIPVGAGKYGPAFFDAMAKDPDVAFVVPRTRTISARLLSIRNPATRKTLRGPALVPTGAGDPLLAANTDLQPGMGQTVLSFEAARRLEAQIGSELTGWIERNRDGQVERVDVPLSVIGIVPQNRIGRVALFVPFEMLSTVEDFLDGHGTADTDWMTGAGVPGRETFASFRLYATSIETIPALRDRIEAMGHSIRTRSDDIATVRQIERALAWLFLIIAIVAGGGFWLSLVASLRSNVERMRHVISMFRLLGADRATRILFPIAQATIIVGLGAVFSVIVSLAVAWLINLQSEPLLGTSAALHLGSRAVLATALLLMTGAALAALGASLAAMRIGTDEVVRHV